MGAGQWEPCNAVIEGCVQPCRRIVAALTGLGETGSSMVRIGRTLIILQMAGDASRGCQIEVLISVTL